MAAFMYVIEFQKRGLPHCHILFITETQDHLHTSEDVDNVISAELPLNPNSYPEGPQQEQAKRLEKLVRQNMVHTFSSICKNEGSHKCSKLNSFQIISALQLSGMIMHSILIIVTNLQMMEEDQLHFQMAHATIAG